MVLSIVGYGIASASPSSLPAAGGLRLLYANGLGFIHSIGYP